jgi:hypothetical protein
MDVSLPPELWTRLARTLRNAGWNSNSFPSNCPRDLKCVGYFG